VLWTAVNERDELGSDLVRDYMTAVRDGGFYGWPYSYFGQHLDSGVKPQRPDLVARFVAGLRAGPAHRLVRIGVFRGCPFAVAVRQWRLRRAARFVESSTTPWLQGRVCAGRPEGQPIDVLGGFLDAAGNVRVRPVGVAIDRSGALLVADDVGDCICGVTAGD
jgi:glucose/arabinose dehydrogenase